MGAAQKDGICYGNAENTSRLRDGERKNFKERERKGRNEVGISTKAQFLSDYLGGREGEPMLGA